MTMQRHKTICPVSFPFSSSIGDPGARGFNKKKQASGD
jgi:hypothetical protein